MSRVAMKPTRFNEWLQGRCSKPELQESCKLESHRLRKVKGVIKGREMGLGKM